MLLFVLSPGLIGGLVLPIMGAVPDGAVVLFSGLGPRNVAQGQLKVGVGTLAGSTVMLLTMPWALSIWGGRVDVKDNKAQYTARPKLSNKWSLTQSGVQPNAGVSLNAKVMMVTALAYLIIQGPAFAVPASDSADEAADKERTWALVGLIATALLFLAYSVWQVKSSSSEEQQAARMEAVRKEMFDKNVSVSVVSMLSSVVETADDSASVHHLHTQLLSGQGSVVSSADRERVRPVLTKLYHDYDIDMSNSLDKIELRFLLRDALKAKSMSEVPAEDVADLMARFDKDQDGSISYTEFEDMFFYWLQVMLAGKVQPAGAAAPGINATGSLPLSKRSHSTRRARAAEYHADRAAVAELEGDDEEDDEEEEVAHLSRGQIFGRSFALMAAGLALVMLFSDPAVDVLSAMGDRWGISPFYVSFVVTPFISNASELISSLVFSAKKTKDSISMTFSALLGAATMNNTFCLAIFLALVYVQRLAWEFKAEVLCILLVELIMGVVAMRRGVHPSWSAIVIALLFPLSLGFVALLENVAGLD